MKQISSRRLKDLPIRALKSYAHGQEKKAERLRDEASKLTNKATAAERAEKLARAEIAARQAQAAIAQQVAPQCRVSTRDGVLSDLMSL